MTVVEMAVSKADRWADEKVGPMDSLTAAD